MPDKTNPNVDFCSTKVSNCCNSFFSACFYTPLMNIICCPLMCLTILCGEELDEEKTCCYQCDLFSHNLCKCCCHFCDQAQLNKANENNN